jgi:flagellar biosynthesis protein FliR
MHFTLVDGVGESNGESLPPGTEVLGRVVTREAGDNDEPGRVRVALASLTKDGATIPLVSGQTLLTMQRQSATGSVVKYSIIGSVVGAGGALVFKKPVIAGAVIGAAVGAAAGGVVAANSDVCMPASETVLQFILLKAAVVRVRAG